MLKLVNIFEIILDSAVSDLDWSLLNFCHFVAKIQLFLSADRKLIFWMNHAHTLHDLFYVCAVHHFLCKRHHMAVILLTVTKVEELITKMLEGCLIFNNTVNMPYFPVFKSLVFLHVVVPGYKQWQSEQALAVRLSRDTILSFLFKPFTW